jgi:predicted dehydrogenase
MGSTPVRVAMIGFDHWYTALPLAQAFAAHPEVEVVGIADADRNRAVDVLARTGLDAPIVAEKELLEDPRVQAIAAFGSCEKNPAVCVAAAENGKHIVSIKPLARTLDEATQILSAVRRAGVQFLPGESRPRASAFAQQVRRWLDEGRFGRILTANFQTLGGLPRGWPDADHPGWWVDPERAPGGGWIDHSIYHIDLLRWLTGAKVTKVFGVQGNLRHSLGVEDYGHATIEFDSGLVATVEDTWTAPAGGSRQSTTLQGSEGALYHDSLTGKLAVTDPDYGGWVQVAAPPSYPSTVDDVIAAVRGEGEPLATVEDAWENLAVCEAFYRSCATGQPVEPARLPA